MAVLNKSELKAFLDEKVIEYNQPQFIESDPIQIPHLFSKRQDIEIAGLLAATIAWGQRKTIVKNAKTIVELLDFAPYDFVINHSKEDLKKFENFVHRTFNGIDLAFFISSLKAIYNKHKSLEELFLPTDNELNLGPSIDRFRTTMFSAPHLPRSEKHISSPAKGSASKRLIMYLRWMVRPNNTGVDLGIWKDIPLEKLSCPLDVHSGNVARKLKLLKRKQNDWKAVNELDKALKKLDSKDPAKYDFALFGLGVFEGF